MSKKKHIDEMFRDNLSDYKPDFDQSLMDSTWNGISESIKLPMDGDSSASSASGASGFSAGSGIFSWVGAALLVSGIGAAIFYFSEIRNIESAENEKIEPLVEQIEELNSDNQDEFSKSESEAQNIEKLDYTNKDLEDKTKVVNQHLSQEASVNRSHSELSNDQGSGLLQENTKSEEEQSIVKTDQLKNSANAEENQENELKAHNLMTAIRYSTDGLNWFPLGELRSNGICGLQKLYVKSSLFGNEYGLLSPTTKLNFDGDLYSMEFYSFGDKDLFLTRNQDEIAHIQFSVNEIPVAAFKAEVDDNLVSFNLIGAPDQSYIWSLGNGDLLNDPGSMFTYYYENPGNYKVKLVSVNTKGCIDTFVQSLNIRNVKSIKMPNIFTPNGDGINDELKLKNADAIEIFTLVITNLDGQMVFETNDANFVWDGKNINSGKMNPKGDYYYEMVYKYLGQKEPKTKTGLLRLN